MANCLVCTDVATIGVLCLSHGVAIASPGLTSEQLVSRVDGTVAEAALVDAWGTPHPIAGGIFVGREPANAMALLHASVSSKHAELRRGGDGWSVHDLDSRNGVEVDGRRVVDAPLRDTCVVRFGDVRLYFSAQPLPGGVHPTGPGRTAPSRRDEVVFNARLTTASGRTIDLQQRVEGGQLKVGASTLELAVMEFGLLQLLIERRRAVTNPELAYVAWHEISEALGFRSVQADSENVRELVYRVRKKLSGVLPEEMIESRRGIGYRLVPPPA